MNNKKRSSTLLMLIIVVAVILTTSLVIVLTANDNKLAHGQDDVPGEEEINGSNNTDEEDNKEEEVKKPESLNALLIGFDKSNGLSDVVMVAHLDTDTNQVKLISLPRDLFIDFREDGFDKIKKENNIRVKYCKLTEVYSNAGWDDDALLVIKDVVEEVTQLDIDYTAAVTIEGFKNIVDAVGGVEFYVPEKMDYEDEAQDLYIHLKEGLQVLDGDKAEQLVRNRHYKGVPPDLKRIQMQQDFLIAMSNKILGIRDFDQIKELASTVYGHLKTDFGLITANEYVSYIFNLDLKEILLPENRITIPSDGEKINGIWYQTYKKDVVLESIDTLMNKKPTMPAETTPDDKEEDQASCTDTKDDNEHEKTTEAMKNKSLSTKNDDSKIEFVY
ncbi:LCP family protein [Vallitalea guaymasensis]|uniref:LCP family protein n=1 Tax=Vallitalea guaymasensis TaxID=1185412 RepID=A0A8J8MC86_9FIRM|nr:LCP family protein [Vallitalea guaymasensis]QUH30133.1 LCP family protein [Vallitalea guaymasensis]